MIDMDKRLDFQDYLENGLRRKWYVIIPLIVSVFVAYGVYRCLPKIYKASALILVQPQRVPESYVHPIVTDSVTARVNTIKQEILSRNRLEKVIREFNLYSGKGNTAPMEAMVEKLKDAIEVKVQVNPQNEKAQNTFSVSFEGTNPETVMKVTNKIAFLLIEENLRVRESQTESTSEFLTIELQEAEQKLKQKELNIRNFKERSMGQLPEQLDTNLRILERLQVQLQAANEKMRASEDKDVLLRTRERSSVLQNQTKDIAAGMEDLGSSEESLITQLNQLKQELAMARSRYKETHPDVIDLKKKTANLEAKIRRLSEHKSTSETESSSSPTNLDSPTIETRRAREEVKRLKEQIDLCQRRIEETPKKEQELTLLTRDYEMLKSNYQTLLGRKIQAQMAEKLERKQQGEQFKILDPARIPEKPIKPDRNRILLIGGVIGLAAGLGLAWVRELMDQSFHAVSDLEDYLGIPVIATIPNLIEKRKAA
jgi:polysaccharide chain length determinant protein (PEP-CTERM system associated)